LLLFLHAIGFVALHFLLRYGLGVTLDAFGPGVRLPFLTMLWWEIERALPRHGLAVFAVAAAAFFFLDGVLLQQAFARRHWVLGLVWAFAVFAFQSVAAVPVRVMLTRIP